MSEDQKTPGDNSWYLLATLHGRPARADRELQARNRMAWNRYIVRALDDATLTFLMKNKQYLADIAEPITAEEISEVKTVFTERHKEENSSIAVELPNVGLLLLRNFYLMDFTNTQFKEMLQFDGYIFPGRVSFSNSSLYSISFRDVTFLDAVFFEGANLFESSFQNATFFSTVVFENATFSSSADFRSTKFMHWAFFQKATFSSLTSFHKATFSSWALFERTTFSEGSSFEDTTFCSLSRFVNAKMDGPTTFENAIFAHEPPHFFGAKLHESTVFRGIEWPLPLKKNQSAGPFVDAYERLKLEMDKLKNTEMNSIFLYLN